MVDKGITYLVHHIDEGLRVVPKEGMDCVTPILTREDRLDQGREFLHSESASDQTSAGWSVEVEKVGAIGILHKIGEGGTEGVPLWDASAGFWFRPSTSASRVRVAILAGLVWDTLRSVNRRAVIDNGITCLVHHIDNGLRVVPKEGVGRISRIVTREDRLDRVRGRLGASREGALAARVNPCGGVGGVVDIVRATFGGESSFPVGYQIIFRGIRASVQ